MRANQHILSRANIILDTWQATAVRAAPIRRVGSVVLSSLPLPPIKKNSNLMALPELSCQGPPQVGLVSRNDDEAPHDRAFGLRVGDTSHRGHACSLRTGILRRRISGLRMGRSLMGRQQ